MGMSEKKRESKIFKLKETYKKLYIKCKTNEALEVLNEMFELESRYGTETLLKTYERGYLYCDIDHYDSLHKKMKRPSSYYRENNAVGRSMEKVRYYLQKMLERYGEKAKLSHDQLSQKDNLAIGGLKVRIAYTYFYRPFRTERVQIGTETRPAITVGDKVIVPESKHPICENVFVLKEPEGNECAKYIDWIRDAALLNKNHEAFANLGLAYWKDSELFGLESDLGKASATIIAALENYNDFRSTAQSFKRFIGEYDLSDILGELAKENEMASVYYQKVCIAREKHRLEGKIAKMAFEHGRVSLVNEFGDVTWRDKRSGEKIENIDAELKKMEESIANLEKKLESLNS